VTFLLPLDNVKCKADQIVFPANAGIHLDLNRMHSKA